MPHTSSAKKRLRQTEKRRAHNRAIKSSVKTFIKRFEASLTGDNLASDEGKKKADDAFRLAVKKLDQAAAKGTLHKNMASRKKSQLARKLDAAKAKQ